MWKRVLVGLAVACTAAVANGTTVEETGLTPEQTQAVVEGVGRTLKDSESARYRLSDLPLIQLQKTVKEYCGCVNAKNSYGGYTGMKPFYGALTTDKSGKPVFVMISRPDAPAATDEMVCRSASYALDCY